MTDMDFDGKSAVITGSSSGIGLGIAEGFADAGINLMMNGLETDEEVENTRACLGDLGVSVEYSRTNPTTPDGVCQLVSEAEAAFGQVDIFVNNACIQHVDQIENFSKEKWEAVFALNRSAAFHAMKAILPGMKQRRWGRIINITSPLGLVVSSSKSACASARREIVEMTKSVALDAASHGITANAICPGYILTPSINKNDPDVATSRSLTTEIERDTLLAAQPTKRFVTVEELAETALFLCSDGAASITGTAIPVDGGWSARQSSFSD